MPIATLQQINELLTIKRINGERFTDGETTYSCKGYAFYVEGNGYIALKADATPEGVLTPYALRKRIYAQKVIDSGGFCDIDGLRFVTPIEA